LTICILCVLAYAIGIYKLGDKPLSGHLTEIYRSDLVQKKLSDLERGIEGKVVDHVEKSKHTRRTQVVANDNKPSTPPATTEAAKKAAAPVPVIDVRPSAGKPKATPAKDTLTDADRQGLDSLLSEKLK
jgi:hypothetical protein